MRTLETRAAAAIGWITILTGAAQMIAPAPMLSLLKAENASAPAHLFATVGMFMVLFGAALVHALRTGGATASVVLLWAGLQKLGAAAMVGWGVSKGVFDPLALLVAGFDLFSGLLFFDLRRRNG